MNKLREEGKRSGIGVVAYVEGTGIGPYEGARVQVQASGKVSVATGIGTQGQSHFTSFAQLVADQLGDGTVLDRRVSGLGITITTALAEQRLKDNWKVVFPHAKLITDGPNKALLIDSQVGDSDLDRSGVLLLQ